MSGSHAVSGIWENLSDELTASVRGPESETCASQLFCISFMGVSVRIQR